MNEITRFLVVGGVSAALNWSSRFLFSLWFTFEVAVVLAFFVGLVSGFILMRLFVFTNGAKSMMQQAGYFVAVNGLALLQTWLISVLLSRYLFPYIGLTYGADGLAHLIGIMAPIVTSYMGHKHFTFK